MLLYVGISDFSTHIHAVFLQTDLNVITPCVPKCSFTFSSNQIFFKSDLSKQ